MKPRIMRAASRPTAKAETANFVGTVLVGSGVFAPEQPVAAGARSRVSFMPGRAQPTGTSTRSARSSTCCRVVGRYQLEGEPVQEIKPGDTVVIPPNARHWHGSAPDTMMVHLAMSETNDKGEATRLVRTGERPPTTPRRLRRPDLAFLPT